ncbi:MAG: MerR family transcriptional regulator [Ruminococcus sp.]|nr:MerR family transcriptional regulator [Ruminococcus sp.]
MKIKTVCERTGLSDRAIRLYIENRLLSPEKTENHTGRRSFDFSEDDVLRLDKIAVLRASGFSIAQIREVQEDPERIPAIVAEVTEKQETELRRSERVLSSLSALEDEIGSFEELADRLTDKDTADVPKTPAEDDRMRLRYLIARFIEGAYSAAVIDGVVRTVILVALVFFGYYVKFSSDGGYLFSAGMWTDIAVIALATAIAVCAAWFTLRDEDAVNLSVKLFLSNLIVAAAVGLMFLVWLIARIILYPVRPIPNYETIHIAELWIGFIGVSAIVRITVLILSFQRESKQSEPERGESVL